MSNSPRRHCSKTPASRTKPLPCCSSRSSVIPIIPGVRYQIALIQDKAGLTRESIKNFESLLKDRPEDASLLNALGYSLADRNQKLPRAESLIRKALAASPDNPAFLDSLGWVLFRRGDIPGGVAAPGARLPHLPGRGDRLALGRVFVGERQAGRSACAVGAIAGALAGFQATARHHRAAHRRQAGSGARETRRSARRGASRQTTRNDRAREGISSHLHHRRG